MTFAALATVSLALFMVDAEPERTDPVAVATVLASARPYRRPRPHICSMSTTKVALTAHPIAPWETCSPSLIREPAAEIERRFEIRHVTIQIVPAGVTVPCAEERR